MNLAIFISGSGSTMEAIIKSFRQNELPHIYKLTVISSNPNAAGIEKAQKLQIPVTLISPKNFSNESTFGRALLEVLREHNINFISQNGWLPLTPSNVLEHYHKKIMNQHPGPLDPGRIYDFGGKGMYGRRVIAARLLYCLLTNEPFWTEATTHFISEVYDQGELIHAIKMKYHVPFTSLSFKEIAYKKDEIISLTNTIQQQLFPLEHKNVIESLKLASSQKVTGYKREKQLIPDDKIDILKKVKQLAIELFPNG